MDHARQCQQFGAYTQLALGGSVQVHDKARSVCIHYKLHDSAGVGETVHVADSQYTGGLKAGQDLWDMLAFGRADEENVTPAQIVTETLVTYDDAAPLHFLSRGEALEVKTKPGVTSKNSKHDWRLSIVKRTLRPFHEFGYVE